MFGWYKNRRKMNTSVKKIEIQFSELKDSIFRFNPTDKYHGDH